MLQCGHSPQGHPRAQGTAGMLSLSPACHCWPGHGARERLLGILHWLLEVLVKAVGDFNPFSPGLLQYGSSRCCKGREKCRKPSGMLLKYSSLLQLGEGSELGR